MDLTGGAGPFKRNRLEQLFRDCRLGRFHPGSPLFAHEVVGRLSLGVDPDAQPRWAEHRAAILPTPTPRSQVRSTQARRIEVSGG